MMLSSRTMSIAIFARKLIAKYGRNAWLSNHRVNEDSEIAAFSHNNIFQMIITCDSVPSN